jgi:NADPH:quinone reductase-like Zn-dependent oxidoreductase
MIPDTMRAAVIDKPGGPDVVQIRDVPVPTVDAGDVLIAVHAAGIASWDAEMRDGWWPGKRPRGPIILGTDGAGTIAAIGARVRRFAVGDPVYAYSFGNPKGGFHAEFVAVPAECVAPIPAGLDMLHAGALPAAGLTALEGVAQALRIRRGETMILHAASGSLGTLALQFAKGRGARVLAVASGRDGLALVQRLGADAAVDGKRGQAAEKLRQFAADGVDGLLAFAGGDAANALVALLKRGGRLAYPNGVEPRPRGRRGVEVITFDADGSARGLARLGRAVEAVSLEVPIAATFPLSQAARAHRRLAKGHALGRVMLQVR